MDSKRLAIGAAIAFLGGAGIIIGPLLGLSEFARSWSFILGFIFGVIGGVGAALTLVGLYEKRKSHP